MVIPFAYIFAGGIIVTCIAVPIISFTGKDKDSDKTSQSTEIVIPETEETSGSVSTNVESGNSNTADADTSNTASSNPDKLNSGTDNADTDSDADTDSVVANSNASDSSDNSVSNDTDGNSSSNNSDTETNSNNATDNSNNSANDNDNEAQTLDQYEATGKDNEISFDMFG